MKNNRTTKANSCSGSTQNIPRRLPDGSENPEYRKLRYAKMKEAGTLPKRDPAYYQKRRAKRKADGVKEKWNTYEARKGYINEWRKTPKGKECVKRYNESDKAKATRARYHASKSGQRNKTARIQAETGDEYAARIIREIETRDEYNEA